MKRGDDMARPSKCRRICREPAFESFAPDGISSRGNIVLTLDEYEAIRLIDLEKNTHEQCAAQMEVSRSTVTEIYEAARYKIADSLVHGKALLISGGHYRFCDGTASAFCHRSCVRTINPQTIQRKEEMQMRIAVTYQDGMIFQHFGHTEQFKLYDVENGKIVRSQVVDTQGQGHGALSGFLAQAGVDVLICGGIGGGAQTALKEAEIQLFGGVAGSADEAVQAYLAGDLAYNPDVHCSHHHHEQGHSCGDHACQEDKHGCAGNEGAGRA